MPTSADLTKPRCFLLAGIGDQYPGMGAGLYESEPVFRNAVDHCARIVESITGRDIRTALYPANAAVGRERSAPPNANAPLPGIDLRSMVRPSSLANDDEERLNHSDTLQFALFVTEYALAALWKSRGEGPAAMLGYSLGEQIAATLSGVFELEDAFNLVAARSNALPGAPEGAMLAVPLAHTELTAFLGTELFVAAVNAPDFTVLAGTVNAVVACELSLAELGVAYRRLRARHPFHTPLMESLSEPIANSMRGMRLGQPTIPYISNISGAWTTAAAAGSASYWSQQLCTPIQFALGVQTMLRDVPGALIEIGPGATLTSFAVQSAGAEFPDLIAVSSLPYSYDRTGDADYFNRSVRSLQSVAQTQRVHDSALSEAQQLIAGMWRELLGLRRVELHDDFFQLGGHSLRAMQLISRIRDTFQVELAPGVIFEARTVAGVARAVEAAIVAEVQGLTDEQVSTLL